MSAARAQLRRDRHRQGAAHARRRHVGARRLSGRHRARRHDREKSYSHAGEEAGLVLEGALELVVSGKGIPARRRRLLPFRQPATAQFLQYGRKTTRVVWVNARPEEI
ncbi:MAG: hypothetical protein WDO24_02680 [Pseudomonadota bacterium]